MMTPRVATDADVSSACRLLNEIIKIGRSTAFEIPLDEDEFRSYFLSGKNCVICHVCEDQNSMVLGFQALSNNIELPDDWVDIATFARVKPKVRGVGTVLFRATLAYAEALGVRAINATIRADNNSGLSYYSKLGFVDYQTHESIPLMDGTPVDRICKRYDVESLSSATSG